jgi:hypothetical protein
MITEQSTHEDMKMSGLVDLVSKQFYTLTALTPVKEPTPQY